MMKDSGTGQEKKIYELTEICEEQNGPIHDVPNGKNSQPVIVVDGRGYERVQSNGDHIHDLTEIVDDDLSDAHVNDMVLKRAEKIIEKVAREVIPDIVERVVREEIKKIKVMYQNYSSNQD